jgi:hypothetical protein
MKIVAKPIEVISVTDTKGTITPLRFRLILEVGSNQVIKIDKVITRELEKLAGNLMISFKCQSLIGDEQKLFELKYELSTSKWKLFKI